MSYAFGWDDGLRLAFGSNVYAVRVAQLALILVPNANNGHMLIEDSLVKSEGVRALFATFLERMARYPLHEVYLLLEPFLPANPGSYISHGALSWAHLTARMRRQRDALDRGFPTDPSDFATDADYQFHMAVLRHDMLHGLPHCWNTYTLLREEDLDALQLAPFLTDADKRADTIGAVGEFLHGLDTLATQLAARQPAAAIDEVRADDIWGSFKHLPADGSLCREAGHLLLQTHLLTFFLWHMDLFRASLNSPLIRLRQGVYEATPYGDKPVVDLLQFLCARASDDMISTRWSDEILEATDMMAYETNTDWKIAQEESDDMRTLITHDEVIKILYNERLGQALRRVVATLHEEMFRTTAVQDVPPAQRRGADQAYQASARGIIDSLLYALTVRPTPWLLAGRDAPGHRHRMDPSRLREPRTDALITTELDMRPRAFTDMRTNADYELAPVLAARGGNAGTSMAILEAVRDYIATLHALVHEQVFFQGHVTSSVLFALSRLKKDEQAAVAQCLLRHALLDWFGLGPDPYRPAPGSDATELVADSPEAASPVASQEATCLEAACQEATQDIPSVTGLPALQPRPLVAARPGFQDCRTDEDRRTSETPWEQYQRLMTPWMQHRAMLGWEPQSPNYVGTTGAGTSVRRRFADLGGSHHYARVFVLEAEEAYLCFHSETRYYHILAEHASADPRTLGRLLLGRRRDSSRRLQTIYVDEEDMPADMDEMPDILTMARRMCRRNNIECMDLYASPALERRMAEQQRAQRARSLLDRPAQTPERDPTQQPLTYEELAALAERDAPFDQPEDEWRNAMPIIELENEDDDPEDTSDRPAPLGPRARLPGATPVPVADPRLPITSRPVVLAMHVERLRLRRARADAEAYLNNGTPPTARDEEHPQPADFVDDRQAGQGTPDGVAPRQWMLVRAHDIAAVDVPATNIPLWEPDHGAPPIPTVSPEEQATLTEAFRANFGTVPPLPDDPPPSEIPYALFAISRSIALQQAGICKQREAVSSSQEGPRGALPPPSVAQLMAQVDLDVLERLRERQTRWETRGQHGPRPSPAAPLSLGRHQATMFLDTAALASAVARYGALHGFDLRLGILSDNRAPILGRGHGSLRLASVSAGTSFVWVYQMESAQVGTNGEWIPHQYRALRPMETLAGHGRQSHYMLAIHQEAFTMWAI